MTRIITDFFLRTYSSTTGQWKVNGDSYMILYSLVCLLPCKLLACWRGSRGPCPWCGHSSGACLRGKPRTCHRDGHSNTSAPEPAGGETRHVTWSGVLDIENRKKKSIYWQIRSECGQIKCLWQESFLWFECLLRCMVSNTDHGLWSLRSLSGFSVHLHLLCFFENLTF